MSIAANEKVCWTLLCDSCGEGDDTEYGGICHYGSREEAVKAVEGNDWVVTGDLAFCGSCIENEDAYDSDDIEPAVRSLIAKAVSGNEEETGC
jgi:hypothetical protein